MKGARSERLKQRRHEYNAKNKEKKQSAREDKTEKIGWSRGLLQHAEKTAENGQ